MLLMLRGARGLRGRTGALAARARRRSAAAPALAATPPPAAAAAAVAGAPLQGWSAAAPTSADAAVIEARQLGHKAQIVAVPAAPACRAGFPQAAMLDPSGKKFGAGLARLTCP